MAISGSSVHSEIKSKINEVQYEIKQSSRQISGYEADISRLTGDREQSFAQLAAFYLPTLDADSVKKTVSELQSEVNRIFIQKQQRRNELEDGMEQTSVCREKLHTSIEQITEQIESKFSEVESVRKTVAGVLSRSDAYSSLDQQAKQANEALLPYKKRVSEAAEDSKNKLPAYEKNPLFAYLLKRKFGTNEYNANSLIYRLDAWVAGIVGFKQQKESYDFLKAMPKLMKLEVDKRQDLLDDIIAKMNDIEQQAESEHDLPKLLQDGRNLEEQKAKYLAELEQADCKYETLARERATFDTQKDEYHVAAVRKLKDYLKGESISGLKQRAAKTPHPEDDDIVGNIEHIDGKVSELKGLIKQEKSGRDEAEKKLAKLKNIERRFTSEDYESRRSYFDTGFNINSFLVGYLAGSHSESEVFRQMERHQHFKQEEQHYSSSSYSSSRGFGGSGGHSSSFGSFGGFGGGGGHSSSFGGFSGGGGGSRSIGGF